MEKKILAFNPIIFANYISELRAHLFDDQTLEDILVGVDKNHRNRRFIAMYFLQSPEIFQGYYQKQRELGLERIFSQAISCLLTRTEENQLKQDLVKYLGIKQVISDGLVVTEYEIKEMDKDLNTYSVYQTRREIKE
jgi:tagatose-1,6-bisphosphate aldolase non-catalytic subunit AgaZ/GatZ